MKKIALILVTLLLFSCSNDPRKKDKEDVLDALITNLELFQLDLPRESYACVVDEISDNIMNIKDGWVASTYSNHDGNIGVKKSRERVVMDEQHIKSDNRFWNPLSNASKAVIDAYKKRHPYMYYYNPISMTSFRINRYKKGGFMSEHVDNIHHSHGQKYGFPQSSLLYFLNDNYEGGEIIIADPIYNPQKNSAIIFPSNFMFPHSVNQVLEGTRYSIITWLM